MQSSPTGARLGGPRTRKKHKRLDAISEDVFNQSHSGNKIKSNEGSSSSKVDDLELRRSSRVRRAPVVLDASPPPPKKRRKINKLGKEIGRVSGKKLGNVSVEAECSSSESEDNEKLGKKIRGVSGKKGNVVSEAESSSSESEDDDEELGAWRSRLRCRVKKAELSLKGSKNQPRRKRKLFQDDEEDEMETETVKDEFVGNNESSRDVGARYLIDHLEERSLEDGGEPLRNDGKLCDDPSEGEALREEDNGDCSLSTRENSRQNEVIVQDGHVNSVENDSEVPMDMVHEKRSTDDYSKDSAVNDESSHSSKSVKDLKDDRVDIDVPSAEIDCNDEVNAGENEVKSVEQNNDAKVENCNAVVDGFSKQRIKVGRRCGLCGGGTDGKPPKRLADDSNGSDHAEYSGSSASEEVSYDPWDGFGDEPGWLGRILGPINDRYGIAGIWVHQHCAVWSPEVYFAGLGCLKNVRAALCRGKALKCIRCGRAGATLGCRVDRCPRTYHLPCARASGCIFDHRKFLIACADHRYLFQPQGHQYAQHIKKLKAKKMKLEIRKVSNDASRKDIEAEEKWMEKCGEDEEFLRRETKRLQRDLSRIAPVYIGGPHSQGDNLFDGWESVAGLQDVIKCLKEVVILPLLYPQFFDNMGITPPRGVLLHGYPGTGKTLVVRALIGACARGDKRIAYFARKGADCLGKYVGDAERQLRLLFQVAEKSQPSVIFFDEIDGLAPVRTRQQDQTHSSVVSTLLALMDGLKSRGSVIVIGATNRPDAIDPALRRPGRFDREIYFPLPSVKDRASILALHTRKWPKPVCGPLLDWVASKTVGFAGADLQALCAQTAVIALKRNCSWQEILSSSENNYVEGKRPMLPSFTVEERDWLEALSLAPPPCSRREAGMAASEVLGSPLHIHLIPCLLEPLLRLVISLCLDERLWLPPRLVNAAAATKKALVSVMEKRSMPSDKWWFYALSMVQESSIRREIVNTLSASGILDGDGSCDYSNSLPCSVDLSASSSIGNLSHTSSKKGGYRILIAGDPRSGQKHLASSFLYCFVGSVEMQKIDLATISQEGHGDMEQGISHILMKCVNMKLSGLFMPRIDLWAIQSIQDSDTPQSGGEESNLMPCNGVVTASHVWKSFVEQLQCICVSSSLIILATSELSRASLPHEVCGFFGGDPVISEGSNISKHATPRFTVELKGEFDREMWIDSSALDISKHLTQQFIHLVHRKNHTKSDSSIASGSRHSVEGAESKQPIPKGSVTKTPSPLGSRPGKEKSTLEVAISTFGYQILTYPHFAELCWVTSKLKEGQIADTIGPWKGWPFNSCIVRSCKKETVVSNSNNIKGKDKFTLVRGLIAIGLSAYRGMYKTPTEVSLEVRKLLEVLVVQIGARIQSGKDRYQFIRILSQVAFLEDMVNNWAHSLKSLEADAPHITPVIPKLSSAQSPDNYTLQTPSDNPLQVDDVTEPQSLDETLPNKVSDDITPENNFSEETANNEKVILVNNISMPVTDLDRLSLGISSENGDMERKSLKSKPTEDIVIISASPDKSKDANIFLGSENVYSYNCCIGCIITLHESVKRLVTQAWGLSETPNTVEDAHDLVSSLSTTLCSSIRSLYLSSEDNFINIIKCACHEENDFPEENDRPRYVTRYVFRDGVLITEDRDMEIPCHCKYDTTCLRSLIDLIVMTKHPSN